MPAQTDFCESSRVWSGKCTYKIGDDALQGQYGVLEIFIGGLEVAVEATQSSFSLINDVNFEETIRDEANNKTRIPFKGLVQVDCDLERSIAVESSGLGVIIFYDISDQRVKGLRRLVNFFITRSSGGEGKPQHEKLLSSRTEIDLISAFEFEEYMAILQKTFNITMPQSIGQLYHLRNVCSSYASEPCDVYLVSPYLCFDSDEKKVVNLNTIATLKVRKNRITVKFLDGREKLELKIDADNSDSFFKSLKEAWLMTCYAECSNLKNKVVGSTNDLLHVLKRLYLHFDSLDADNNGFVKKKHFQSAMQPLLQSSEFSNYIFRALADEERELMNFVTFLSGMGETILGDTADKLNFSFKLFDVNQDGHIDLTEFTEALRLFHSLGNFKLPKNETLEEFAARLFNQELGPRSSSISVRSPINQPFAMSFKEYKACLLHNEELHLASESLANFAQHHTHTDALYKRAKDKFILFGNRDWELASRILHGITRSVINAHECDVKKVKEWIANPSTGTPAQLDEWLQKEKSAKSCFVMGKEGYNEATCTCSLKPSLPAFTDYAPQIFRLLRRQYGLDKTAYLRSLGIDIMVFNLLFGNLCTLKQMSSSSLSGSIFFVSHDERFIVKSLPSDEFNTFRKMLPQYFKHMTANPDSLITRFCGLYSANLNGKKIRIVAMAHVFTPSPGKEIKQVYDLKGSTVNRSVKVKDNTVAMKDLNLNRCIELRWDWRQRLLWQMNIDALFLESQGLIDYSFLLGIDSSRRRAELPMKSTVANRNLKALKTSEKMATHTGCTCVPNVKLTEPLTAIDHIDSSKDSVPSNLQGCNAFAVHEGGVSTSDNTEVVYFGIIDILTKYDWQKWSEHRLKRLCHGRMRMSCVPPAQYRARFITFISEVFTKPQGDVPMLKLPANVSPGGRFRAVSEAGLSVELVVSAHPDPMIWVITRPKGTAPDEEGETAFVRSKCRLEDVVFGNTLDIKTIDRSNAQKEKELILVMRTDRLFPAKFYFKMDTVSKYRFLASSWNVRNPGHFTHASIKVTVVHLHFMSSTCLTDLTNHIAEMGENMLILVCITVEKQFTAGLKGPVEQLALKLSRAYHLESVISCKECKLALFVPFSERGIVTDLRSSAGSQDVPVCVMLMQLGQMPIAVVASPCMSDPKAFHKAVRFISRSMQVEGSILELIPATIWLTFETEDGEEATYADIGVFNRFCKLECNENLLYHDRQNVLTVFDAKTAPLMSATTFDIQMQDDIFAPFAKYTPETGTKIVLRGLRLQCELPDRWPKGVTLNVSGDFLPQPSSAGNGSYNGGCWCWPDLTVLPLGTEGHRLAPPALMRQFLSKRCLVLTINSPVDATADPNDQTTTSWVYHGVLQGAVPLIDISQPFSVEMHNYGLRSQCTMKGTIALV